MKLLLILSLFFSVPLTTNAQTDSDIAKQIILNTCLQHPSTLNNPNLVLSLYDRLQYKTAWLHSPILKDQLYAYFRNSAQYGLNTPLYLGKLQLFMNTPIRNPIDSLILDIKLSDLIISLGRDIIYGNQDLLVGYAGINSDLDCIDIPQSLANAILSMKFDQWIDTIENKNPEYQGLKKEIISALTEPGSTDSNKLKALFNAINTFRRINCLQKKEKVVIVNIPSATLTVYERDSILLNSRVIVGKRSTPTPTLSSTITQLILYPYWTVPHKIASRELLPLIKKHPGYLRQNNFQVLDKANRIIDPNRINWQPLSANDFPYTLRQSTGCDNSLGLIKLDFNSPYSVYLHDTPWKLLFLLPERFFSHGCVRVEKANELGKLLMGVNSIAVDTLLTRNPPATHPSVFIKLPSATPVFLLYNTAWPDSSGAVHFFRDIYHKN